MQPRPDVVYVLPDKMGGMFTVVAQLIAHRPRDRFGCAAVLTRDRADRSPRGAEPLAADSAAFVEFDTSENLWAVVQRLGRAIRRGPGVLVTGDLLDLAAASTIDFGRMVVFVLHGSSNYYQDLATRHERAIHAFVACSRHIGDELGRRLPHRASDVHVIPHGVPAPVTLRRPAAGPLRAVFVGRLDVHKGVLDLPAIDRAAVAMGADVRWTIVGDGPLGDRLREQWREPDRVRFPGALAPAEIGRLLADHDVLVLPTRSEGMPIAVLEAMNAGVVPIVTDLPSGVPEIIAAVEHGFRVSAASIDGFASAIATLARDRRLLDRMSAAAAARVRDEFSVSRMVDRYYAVYDRYTEQYRPLGAGALAYGSRLDKWWIPNPIVRSIRRTTRRLKGSVA